MNPGATLLPEGGAERRNEKRKYLRGVDIHPCSLVHLEVQKDSQTDWIQNMMNKSFTTEQLDNLSPADMRYEFAVLTRNNRHGDKWTCILATSDKTQAMETANFWNERVDTQLFSLSDVAYAHELNLSALVESYGVNSKSELGKSLARQFCNILKTPIIAR